MSGGESNPGPAIRFGSLSANPVVRRGPSIQDHIDTHGLQALAVSESWIVIDDTDTIKLDRKPTISALFIFHVILLPEMAEEVACVSFTIIRQPLNHIHFNSR